MEKNQEKYSTEIDTEFAKENPEIARSLVRHESFYSTVGLIVGLLCFLGGIVLIVLGVTGETNWTMKLLGAESSISDAAPGVVLFIVGISVLLITRHRVKINKT